MGNIKFTTRNRNTDGFGQTISIDVSNYVEDTTNIFLGKPLNKLASSYTVYNKNYKELNQ